MSVKFKDLELNFVSKNGTKSKFCIKKRDYGEETIKQILRCVAFYTICLFQTDSTDQRIVYSREGHICCDKIINIIKKYVYPNDNDDSDSENETDIETENEEQPRTYPEYEYRVKETFFKDIAKLPQVKKITDAGWPIGYNVERTSTTFETPAMLSLEFANTTYDEKNDGENKLYDFYSDHECKLVKVVKVVDPEPHDVPGNWGDHLIDKDREILNKHQLDIERRYVAFDFDKCAFDVKEVIDNTKGHSDNKKFNTHISSDVQGIHHAASMWGQKCIVEASQIVESYKPQYIDSMEITMTSDDTRIYFESEYFAIDCL